MLSKPLVQKIFNVLAKLPYEQIAGLMNEIQVEVAEFEKIKKEEKKEK